MGKGTLWLKKKFELVIHDIFEFSNKLLSVSLPKRKTSL